MHLTRDLRIARGCAARFYLIPLQVNLDVGIHPLPRDHAMNFGGSGPVPYLFSRIIVLLPLLMAVWLVAEIVGIRHSLERIGRVLEAKAKRVE